MTEVKLKEASKWYIWTIMRLIVAMVSSFVFNNVKEDDNEWNQAIILVTCPQTLYYIGEIKEKETREKEFFYFVV